MLLWTIVFGDTETASHITPLRNTVAVTLRLPHAIVVADAETGIAPRFISKKKKKIDELS